MPKLKPGTVRPTEDEAAAIHAGIAADANARELDDVWFDDAKPAREGFQPSTYAALVAMKRPFEGSQSGATQEFTAIRLDADLLATFKATGEGWQGRINAALRQYIKEHPLSSQS